MSRPETELCAAWPLSSCATHAHMCTHTCTHTHTYARTHIPAGLIDMAVKKNVLIGGDDFKSGQTKLKSVLVDYLVGGSMQAQGRSMNGTGSRACVLKGVRIERSSEPQASSLSRVEGGMHMRQGYAIGCCGVCVCVCVCASVCVHRWWQRTEQAGASGTEATAEPLSVGGESLLCLCHGSRVTASCVGPPTGAAKQLPA